MTCYNVTDNFVFGIICRYPKKHSMKTIKYQSVTDILTQVDPSFLEHFRKNTCTHNSPCSSFSSCAWMLQSLWAALRIPGAVSHMKLVATTWGHVAGQGGRLGEYSRLLNLWSPKNAATSSNPPIGFPFLWFTARPSLDCSESPFSWITCQFYCWHRSVCWFYDLQNSDLW